MKNTKNRPKIIRIVVALIVSISVFLGISYVLAQTGSWPIVSDFSVFRDPQQAVRWGVAYQHTLPPASMQDLANRTINVVDEGLKSRNVWGFLQTYQMRGRDPSVAWVLRIMADNHKWDKSGSALKEMVQLVKDRNDTGAGNLVYYLVSGTQNWSWYYGAWVNNTLLPAINEELRLVGMGNALVGPDEIRIIPTLVDTSSVGGWARIGERSNIHITVKESMYEVIAHEITHNVTLKRSGLSRLISRSGYAESTWRRLAWNEISAETLNYYALRRLGIKYSYGYSSLMRVYTSKVREVVVRTAPRGVAASYVDYQVDQLSRQLVSMTMKNQESVSKIAEILNISVKEVEAWQMDLIRGLQSSGAYRGMNIPLSLADDVEDLKHVELFVDEAENFSKFGKAMKWVGKITKVAGLASDVFAGAEIGWNLVNTMEEYNWDLGDLIADKVTRFMQSGYLHKTGDSVVIPLYLDAPVVHEDVLIEPTDGTDPGTMLAAPIQEPTYVLTGEEGVSPDDVSMASFMIEEVTFRDGDLVSIPHQVSSMTVRDENIQMQTFAPADWVINKVEPYQDQIYHPAPGEKPKHIANNQPVGEIYTWKMTHVGYLPEDLFGNAQSLNFSEAILLEELIGTIFGAQEDSQILERYPIPMSKWEVVEARRVSLEEYLDWVNEINVSYGAEEEGYWISPLTGYAVSGGWLTAFNQAGGVKGLGHPISPVIEDPEGKLNVEGEVMLVQNFDNGTLEHHSENAGTEYEYMRRLHVDNKGIPTATPVPEATPGPPGCRYFRANPDPQGAPTGTGHYVCNAAPDGRVTGFLDYFDSHGAVTACGYPKEEQRLVSAGVYEQQFQACVYTCAFSSGSTSRSCVIEVEHLGRAWMNDRVGRDNYHRDPQTGTVTGQPETTPTPTPRPSSQFMDVVWADEEDTPAINYESDLSYVTLVSGFDVYRTYLDSAGRFTFNVPEGEYELTLTVPGLKTMQATVRTMKGELSSVVFPEVRKSSDTDHEVVMLGTVNSYDTSAVLDLALGSLFVALIPGLFVGLVILALVGMGYFALRSNKHAA